MCLLNTVTQFINAMFSSIWCLGFPWLHFEPRSNVIVWPLTDSLHTLRPAAAQLWHVSAPAAALTLGMGSGVQWRGGGGTGHHGLLGAHAGPGGRRRQTEKPPRKASNQSALIHRRQHAEPVRTEGGAGAEVGAWPGAAARRLGRVTTSCRDGKQLIIICINSFITNTANKNSEWKWNARLIQTLLKVLYYIWEQCLNCKQLKR